MTSSSMAFQLGASSSSSSPSLPSFYPWNHDVFLSFRGEDVRPTFISHLYQALDQRGINTYIDKNLERGEKIPLELFKAIEGSRISIVVLSKNYAESQWCLKELLKILKCKKTMKQIVLPIFYDVDPTEVRHQKGNFGKSFDKLGDKLMDNAKMLKWKNALKRVADLSGFQLANFRDEAEFIQTIIGEVDSRILEKTPLSVAKYPIGIESRIQDIYQHLSIERNDIIRVVGIFGTGGIGKTTVSKDIYNRISSQFEGSCFLKNIRETSKQAGGLIQLQKTLLYEILGISLEVHDIDKGINVIKHRLCSKRIILILDDVDELVQLEKLVGDCAWLYSGSRIIITTRDQQLLTTFEVDSEYKLNFLNHNEALQLFSLHAFKMHKPPDDYVGITNQVIKYAQGLPLAIIVLGSDLKCQNIDQWDSALAKYKSIPNNDIQKVLLASYEGLHHTEREIFLDIAFFFKGKSLADVMKIFDSCGFSPVHGIKRLIDKCLIEDSNGYVGMHDLLQDMGREIVRLESPKEPSKRSRLWFHKDIREVLEESTIRGPNKVEGMLLDLPEGDHDEINLHPEAFGHMKRLRVFINRNARFSCGPNYLPENLRVLDWSQYPSHSLPHNFCGKNLAVIKMCDSLIKELGNGFNPKHLRTVVLLNCKFLKKIPDLSSISNLEELFVQHCRRLVEVHDSVGYSENLSFLSFKGCTKLRILPRSLKLRSLRVLQFGNCSSLRHLPKIECEMESLITLDISGTAVKELPLSIRNLTGLHHLFLSNCKNLVCLPLQPNLRTLCIGGFTNMVKKKRDCELSFLPIESTAMEDDITLTSSEEQLHELVTQTNSSNGSTASLQLSNLQISCSQSESSLFPLYSFFTMFNSSSTLDYLSLSGTEIVNLPTSIIGFVNLKFLRLQDCKKLEEILELPPNLRQVNVTGCKSLERYPEVSRILELNGSHIRSPCLIVLEGCDKMNENIWNWNDKAQNPLLWKGLYDCDATLFPKRNQIPEWFSYVYDFLRDNEMVKGPDDDVQRWRKEEPTIDNEMMKGPDDDNRQWRKEERTIDIEGPYHLDEISGIVLYAVQFFKHTTRQQRMIRGVAKITSNSSNHVCRIEGVRLLSKCDLGDVVCVGYDVWVGYSNLQSFELKVLDNLRVQFDFYVNSKVPFYRSYRVKIVYKNERRTNMRKREGKMDIADVAKSHDH